MATESTWATVAGIPAALGSGERAVVVGADDDAADDGADDDTGAADDTDAADDGAADDTDAADDNPVRGTGSAPVDGSTEAGMLSPAESGTGPGDVAMAGAAEVVAGPAAGGAEQAASSRAAEATMA